MLTTREWSRRSELQRYRPFKLNDRVTHHTGINGRIVSMEGGWTGVAFDGWEGTFYCWNSELCHQKLPRPGRLQRTKPSSRIHYEYY